MNTRVVTIIVMLYTGIFAPAKGALRNTVFAQGNFPCNEIRQRLAMVGLMKIKIGSFESSGDRAYKSPWKPSHVLLYNRLANYPKKVRKNTA